MEKLIQLLQGLHEDMGALAWIALGFLLPVCIGIGLIALRWIRCGGPASVSTQEFFAEQREISCWLKDR